MATSTSRARLTATPASATTGTSPVRVPAECRSPTGSRTADAFAHAGYAVAPPPLRVGRAENQRLRIIAMQGIDLTDQTLKALTLQQRAFWHENGYLAIERVIPPEMVEAERQQLDWLCENWDGPEGRRVHLGHEPGL